MQKFKHDMSGEKTPSKKYLFNEGWHTWEVTGIEEKKSKSGKDMFVITLVEDINLQQIQVYAIATPGKRWFLKEFLSACGCAASTDGIYEWGISDVMGKKITGLIEHEDNTWVDREGFERKDKQAKLTSFKKLEI